MTIPLLLFLVLLVVIFAIGATNTIVDEDFYRPLPAVAAAFLIVVSMLIVFAWGMTHGTALAARRTLTISQPTISPADTDRKEAP
jgi:hypothetical protein